MSRTAAKKYAKVILENDNKDEVQNVRVSLKALCDLFGEEKFKDTVLSPLVSREDKVMLLLGDNNDNTILKNLILLLIEKDRLSLIPYIYDELRLALAREMNRYDGYIYSNEDIDSETLSELTDNISKKFNCEIDFKKVKMQESGFKVEVPDIGIEASFTKDRFKSSLIEHILRGI